MAVGPRTLATSMMEFFVAINKKRKLLNIVPKSSILDVTADTKNEKVKVSYYDIRKLPYVPLKSLKITCEEVQI